MKGDSFDRVLYLLIKTFINRLALLPRRQITACAGWIGRLWYTIDKRHRTIALANLAIAYGCELNAAERERLVKANFIQFARVLLEIPSLVNLTKDNLDQYIAFKGQELIQAALQSGKGVVLLSAHMGNWELMSLATSLYFDICINGVVRPIDCTAADNVLAEIRTRTGNRMIDKDDSKDAISALLREGQVVGILLDQNASWYEGVYVPFFGRIACTNKGLALFALRYDALVIPVFNYRLPDGRYEIVINSPLDLIRTGNVSDDIIANTAMFNRVIEKNIRIAPDNWFWVHRRWRLKGVPERVSSRIRNVPQEAIEV
jgi:KDO2-lipid IV(A) lauroyltransferase